MRLILLFGILSQTMAFAAAIDFPSSAAPVKTLILSHVYEEKDVRSDGTLVSDGIEDTRLSLIKDVIKIFPSLDLRLVTEMPEAAFRKKYPQIAAQVSRFVHASEFSIQDPWEFGYAADGGGRVMALDVEDGYVETQGILALVPEYKSVIVGGADTEPVQAPWRASAERRVRLAGGNIEFLLDGTPLVGTNLPKSAFVWLTKNSGKTPVLVESAWNSSGDLDEAFLITHDPLGVADCIVFALDAQRGADLLQKKLRTPAFRLEHRDRKWLETILADALKLAPEIQKTVNRDLNKILAHASMKGCRAEKIPAVYAHEIKDDGSRGLITMAFGNQVNSLVIENHLFTLTSEFPEQHAAAQQVFEKNGFTVHSYSQEGFSPAGGQMHCSSQVIRKKPAVSALPVR